MNEQVLNNVINEFELPTDILWGTDRFGSKLHPLFNTEGEVTLGRAVLQLRTQKGDKTLKFMIEVERGDSPSTLRHKIKRALNKFVKEIEIITKPSA